jgi:hypothetical protein
MEQEVAAKVQSGEADATAALSKKADRVGWTGGLGSSKHWQVAVESSGLVRLGLLRGVTHLGYSI